MKGEELDNICEEYIEDDFSKRFCYCCGATTPKYKYWCDWFQIGGRWPDIIKAKKGIHCGRGWSNDNAPIKKGEFSVAEIKDLTKPIKKEEIYAIATKSRIYHSEYNEEKFNRLLAKINNKQINGIVALIDCHD